MAVCCGDTITIQLLAILVFHGGKLLGDYRRRLVHLINSCASIDCILEKRCVKFI